MVKVVDQKLVESDKLVSDRERLFRIRAYAQHMRHCGLCLFIIKYCTDLVTEGYFTYGPRKVRNYFSILVV